MSDDEIVVLYRSLAILTEQQREERGDDDRVGDGIWEALAADVRGLVNRDPERVKGLVHRCTMSKKGIDREFAARTAASLIDYDYAFTRDVLVFLYADPDAATVEGYVDYSEYAALEMGKLRERLTPEQIADFTARRDFYGMPPM